MKYKLLIKLNKDWNDMSIPVFSCLEDAERYIDLYKDHYGSQALPDFKINEISDDDGNSHDILVRKLD